MPENAIIVGIARSGTSLTASIFVKHGYFVADDSATELKDAIRDNPSRFREPLRLIAANADILRSVGFKEHNTWTGHGITPDQAETTYALQHLDEHKELLRHSEKNRPWVWKEPRLCYTLGYWWPLISTTTTGVLLLTRDADELVSAGFTAKMRPHRMYSELARLLDTVGIPTMRFDLGGIGNSQVLNPGTPLETRTHQDIQDAIDLLQENYGNGRFVVGGLCSGAEDGFRYAEVDDRVKGVLLIDPHAYRTRMWSLRNVLSRYFLNRVICWVLQLTRILKVASDKDATHSIEGIENSLISYGLTPHRQATRILQRLLQRHVRLHYLYTAGRKIDFNHKRQFFNLFMRIEFGSNLILDYFPHIDHTQVFEEDRNELVTVISQRLDATYK